VALERALERGFGLISGRFRHRAGRERRSPQFVCSQRHPDVHQEVGRGATELLLELARKRCSRHIAKPRKLGKRPGPRRIVEKRGNGRRQARMTSQRKETARRIVDLAGEPQHEREHRCRQRVKHGAAAEMIGR
jgi:hypothetical protein